MADMADGKRGAGEVGLDGEGQVHLGGVAR